MRTFRAPGSLCVQSHGTEERTDIRRSHAHGPGGLCLVHDVRAHDVIGSPVLM